jgi:hypothetical protein
VLGTYRMRFGDAAHDRARRRAARWRKRRRVDASPRAMRLLEIVPLYVEEEAKYDLVRRYRRDALARLRQTQVRLDVGREDLAQVLKTVADLVDAQVAVELVPRGVSWMATPDAVLFDRMAREEERQALYARIGEYLIWIRILQREAVASGTNRKLRIVLVYEIETARIASTLVERGGSSMATDPPHDATHDEEHSLLARWHELELESRYRAGEVSYPEYVLRNMDQFFSEEEQAELHKIAAMHGLELERMLMEIQIKSRTSEQDLQKLLETIRNLQDQGISADVVSRHETPSGHIEISARSPKRWGCLPWAGVLGFLGFVGFVGFVGFLGFLGF